MNKEQILALRDRRRVEPVAFGDGEVHVRELSATERDSFEASILDGRKMNLIGVRSKLLARCLCDEQGNRIFSDADATAIGELPVSLVEAAYEKAQSMNKLSPKDTEELVKNSGSGQDAAST